MSEFSNSRANVEIWHQGHSSFNNECPLCRITFLESANMEPLPAHIIADIVTDVDGFKYFWPRNNGGHLAAHHLRKIAMYLDKVNESIEEEYRKYFEEYK